MNNNDPLPNPHTLETAKFVTRIVTQVMEKVIIEVNQSKIPRDMRDMAMISIATSIGSSIIGTVADKMGDKEAINPLFGIVVRGIAESLATHDGMVGHTYKDGKKQ